MASSPASIVSGVILISSSFALTAHPMGHHLYVNRANCLLGSASIERPAGLALGVDQPQELK